jgi:hypothetical protein
LWPNTIGVGAMFGRLASSLRGLSASRLAGGAAATGVAAASFGMMSSRAQCEGGAANDGVYVEIRGSIFVINGFYMVRSADAPVARVYAAHVGDGTNSHSPTSLFAMGPDLAAPLILMAKPCFLCFGRAGPPSPMLVYLLQSPAAPGPLFSEPSCSLLLSDGEAEALVLLVLCGGCCSRARSSQGGNAILASSLPWLATPTLQPHPNGWPGASGLCLLSC